MDDPNDNIKHLLECRDVNCSRCAYLLNDFYMGCDQCGHVGHQDSDGWVTREGIPFCSEQCANEWFGASEKGGAT